MTRRILHRGAENVRQTALHAPDGAQLSVPAARAIDPILTTAARGYVNADHVHPILFPAVQTGLRGGTRIEFDRTDFRRVQTARSPGGRSQRVQFGHSGEKFALIQHALEGLLPVEPMEDAAAVAGIDMGMQTVDGVQALISLEKEILAAELATNAASYDAAHVITPAPAARWGADGSSPQAHIMEAIEIVRQATAKRPNTVVMGGKTYSKVRTHPEVMASIQYKGGDDKRVANKEDLARLWDVGAVAVGDAIWADEDDATHDVWGGDVIVAYTETGSISNFRPSFAYCYQLSGTPSVEEAYYERSTKSWVYPVQDEYDLGIVGRDAGVLLKNVYG